MSLQQSFSYIGMGLPGLNQYLARINLSCSRGNTVMPVRLEPAAPWSRAKHSTSVLPGNKVENPLSTPLAFKDTFSLFYFI